MQKSILPRRMGLVMMILQPRPKHVISLACGGAETSRSALGFIQGLKQRYNSPYLPKVSVHSKTIINKIRFAESSEPANEVPYPDVVLHIACPSASNAAIPSPSSITSCTAATSPRSPLPQQLPRLKSRLQPSHQRLRSHGTMGWRGQRLQVLGMYG